jgi:Mrp family chromosome partitioning ATPase
MTTSNGAPRLDRHREQDPGGLAGLGGPEPVAGQLGERIAVLQAEQARRQAGLTIKRPAWKNLVFTGGPGTGKSRAARAVARVYAELGLLSSGHVDEVAAANVVGTTPRETGILVGETVKRAAGGS